MSEQSSNTVSLIKWRIRDIRHQLDEMEAGLKRDFDSGTSVTPLGWGEEYLKVIEELMARIRKA